MTAAVLLGGAAGCGDPSPAAPRARTSPTPTPTLTPTPGPGYDPDDPVRVVRAALDELNRAGGASIDELRFVSIDGETIETQLTYSYDAAKRALELDTAVWLADGTAAQVRYGVIEDVVIMRAPVEWEQPPQTWYRLDTMVFGTDDPEPWYLRGRAPLGTVEALDGVRTPAWLAAGDERSSTVTYELALPGASAVPALPGNVQAHLLETGFDLSTYGMTLPVSVSVAASGRLRSARLDLSDLVRAVMPEELFDPEVPVEVTAPVELDVTFIGTPFLQLPDLATVLPASAMPEPAPEVVAA